MILVTGGTGLLGAHLLYKLSSTGKKVRAIYRNASHFAHVKTVFSTYTINFEALFNAIDWVHADILDLPALEAALIDITEVYHCAAYVTFAANQHQLLRKINIEGTSNVANLCLEKGIKLCYVSSIATLGKPIALNEITEASVWNPEYDNNDYAISKYGGEMEVWRAIQEGLHAVIINPGVIIGAGNWHTGTGLLFKKAKQGIPFYTSGTIALIAVTDVVDIMLLLMAKNISNERYIIVAENWSYQLFLKALAQSVNSKAPHKLAPGWLLNLAWRVQWISHLFTRKNVQLTRHLCATLQNTSTYNSLKIKDCLNFNFTPIDAQISNIGALYLAQKE